MLTLSNELTHALVVELLYLIQLITCWNLLPQRRDRKKNLILITSIFLGLLIIYNYILFNFGFDKATNLVVVLLTLPGLVLYFIISKYRDGRLFFCYFFSDSILSIFNYLIYVGSLKLFQDQTIPYILTRDISMIIFSILFNVYYIPKIREALHTTTVNWNIIALISSFSGIYIYYELVGRGSILDRQDEILPIALTFILLAIVFLTLLWTLVKIGEKERQAIELLKKESAINLIRIQLKQVDSTYNQINETYEKVRIFRHDINKKLSILEGLSKEGNINKIKEYISQIINTIPDSELKTYSTDHMLNAILNHYNQQIDKNKIKFQISIGIKNLNQNIVPDICIILANAIENAIEATIKTTEKIIKLDISQTSTSLIISIKNTFIPNTLKIGEKQLITSKADIENHGLGLTIIDNIATAHDGNMIYSTEGDEFRLDVWLTL